MLASSKPKSGQIGTYNRYQLPIFFDTTSIVWEWRASDSYTGMVQFHLDKAPFGARSSACLAAMPTRS